MKTPEQHFLEAFRRSQEALGLTHYRVAFESNPNLDHYAQIHRSAHECTARLIYNIPLMERDRTLVSTAVHEATHLAVMDLRWAVERCPDHVADLEDERLVTRLEPLLLKAIFPTQRHR